MVLPGQTAKEIRTQFASIIQRYLAGDHTLISEIQANAVSSSPVAQLARESLQISIEQDLNRKRLREELELEKLTMENKQNNFNFFLGSMNDLDPNWKKDTRLLTQTKDLLKNICFGTQAITNEASATQSTPIYIHEIAIKLGLGKLSHGDACKIGRKAVEMYRAKYNAEPPTRLQYVDGAERQVKCYTEADRDLIEAAVRGVMLV
jgi:AraC-like DNA-binding protein